MSNHAKTGLILLNLGTPDSPSPADVGRYLREFLMDPFVIDIPYLARWFLVNALIVPRRSHSSSALYRKIWTREGSPLLSYTVSLAKKVQAELGEAYFVLPAMRYAKPSLTSVLHRMRDEGVGRLIAFPLYPQYSLAATESSVVRFNELAEEILPGVPRVSVPAFFDDPVYLDAVAEVSRPFMQGHDKYLFSFHGLPERQVKKTDASGSHCLQKPDCCERVDKEKNARCYRAQSYYTAREVAKRLGLTPSQWEVGFQSRLGRTPWIPPFSDVHYETLPQQGVRKLAVLTPSFVADCLETLEEVQMRGQESFQKAGGETLKLIPSLNDHPVWVKAVSTIARRAYQPKT